MVAVHRICAVHAAMHASTPSAALNAGGCPPAACRAYTLGWRRAHKFCSKNGGEGGRWAGQHKASAAAINVYPCLAACLNTHARTCLNNTRAQKKTGCTLCASHSPSGLAGKASSPQLARLTRHVRGVSGQAVEGVCAAELGNPALQLPLRQQQWERGPT
jgi:hypothetical protein